MTNEQLFVERCESIMATENGTWAQLNEKKQTNQSAFEYVFLKISGLQG